MPRTRPPAPSRTNRSNDHVIRAAVAVVTLPLTIVRWGYGAAKALFRMSRSEKALRTEDQLRQSRVRRQLRGLPADHDAAAGAASVAAGRAGGRLQRESVS